MEIENNTQQPQPVMNKTINADWVITPLFAFFLGMLGVHRFYNGKIGTGILMIFTLGGFGIWTLIDIILVALGKFKNKQGQDITIFA